MSGSARLIDGRNRYSLARLQLAGWTVLVLSCWLGIVIARIAANFDLDVALKVGIPAPVVAALGLSVGSFALSSGIKDAKRQRIVSPAVPRQLRIERDRLRSEIDVLTLDWSAERSAAVQEQDPVKKSSLDLSATRKKASIDALTTQLQSNDAHLEAQAKADGLLARNEKPSDASAGDFFRGDEVVDAATVDFGKVQMLYITIGILAVYGLMLVSAINSGDVFDPRPEGASRQIWTSPWLPCSPSPTVGTSQ